MKRGNPSMNKPSTNRINSSLDAYVADTKSKKIYRFDCPVCGDSFTFTEADVKDRVIHCKNCRYEEIFFRSNYS